MVVLCLNESLFFVHSMLRIAVSMLFSEDMHTFTWVDFLLYIQFSRCRVCSLLLHYCLLLHCYLLLACFIASYLLYNFLLLAY